MWNIPHKALKQLFFAGLLCCCKSLSDLSVQVIPFGLIIHQAIQMMRVLSPLYGIQNAQTNIQIHGNNPIIWLY